MNATSASLPRGHNEMSHANLTAAPSRLVSPPRVAEAVAALECVWTETVHLKDAQGQPTASYLVCGEVVGIHIDDRFILRGKVDAAAMRIMARMGYLEYLGTESTVSLPQSV